MSILGTWVVDSTDTRALAELGDVLLDFHEDGQLTYTIRGKTKKQIILMHNISGDTIIISGDTIECH